MSQYTSFNFLDDDSTYALNHKLLGIIPKGVYFGFDTISPTIDLTLKLNHTNGLIKTIKGSTNNSKVLSNPLGVIISNEGVTIIEDNVVTIGPILENSTSNPRIDTIVVNHQYVDVQGGLFATYSIISGTPSSSPVAPSIIDPLTQIKIGELLVPASTTTNLTSCVFTRVNTPSFANDFRLEDLFNNHKNNISNPHNVTKAQVGLGLVDNKSSQTLLDEALTAIRNGVESDGDDLNKLRDRIFSLESFRSSLTDADLDNIVNTFTEIAAKFSDMPETSQTLVQLFGNKANVDASNIAASTWRSILNVYTKGEVDTGLNGKSNVGHTHDDRYYTEGETDSLLNNKASISHNHDDRYDTSAYSNQRFNDVWTNGIANKMVLHEKGQFYIEDIVNDLNKTLFFNSAVPTPNYRIIGYLIKGSSLGTMNYINDVVWCLDAMSSSQLWATLSFGEYAGTVQDGMYFYYAIVY